MAATNYIDPAGNVVLVLTGGGSQNAPRFCVNSHLLCHVSPVFRAMLGHHSRFKEAQSLREAGAMSTSLSGPIVPVDIQLEGDDPKALTVLIWIVHHRADMVPSRLSVTELYDLAILMDKYQIKATVVKIWSEHVWLPVSPSGSITWTKSLDWNDYRLLFISYALRHQALFRIISEYMIKNITLNTLAHYYADADASSHDPCGQWYSLLPETVMCLQLHIPSRIDETY